MEMIAICCIIFLFFLIFTSYNIGDFVFRICKIRLNKWIKILVGYLAMVMVFQIIYYPAQWFQLSSIYLAFSGGIFFLLCLLFDITHYKNLKEVFWNKAIWVIFFIALILFFFYMRTLPHAYWFFDDSFYLPYMYENAYADRLLSIEARSGFEVFKVNNLYSYQGYYLMGSFYILLFDFLGSLFTFSFHYLTVVQYFMSVPTFVLLLMGIYGMADIMAHNKKEKFLYYGISIFYSVFLPYSANILNNVYMNGYIGIFALGTIFIPIVVYFIFQYLRGKREFMLPIIISFFAMLSYASFSMFLILISLFAMATYQVIKKEKLVIWDYLLMAIPLVIYLISFVFHTHAFMIIPTLILMSIVYGIYYKIYLKDKKMNQIIYNMIVWCIKVVPIIFVIGAFGISILRLNQTSVIDYLSRVISIFFPIYGNTEFYYFFLPITLFYLFTVFLIFYLPIREKHAGLSVWWMAIIMGVFLNPLTISFVTTCLTSDVYERIYLLFFNPVVFFVIYQKFISKYFPYTKLVTVGIILLTLVPPLLLLKDFHYWVDVSGRSDKEVRLSEREINGAKVIEEYMEQYEIERPLLATVSMNEYRVYNPNIEMVFTRLYELNPDEDTKLHDYQLDMLYHFLTGKVTNYELISYGTIMDAIVNNQISFVILDLRNSAKYMIDPVYESQYQLLTSKCEKIYETGSYEIYFTGVLGKDRVS